MRAAIILAAALLAGQAHAEGPAQQPARRPLPPSLSANLACLAETIATWPAQVALPFGLGQPAGYVAQCMTWAERAS